MTSLRQDPWNLHRFNKSNRTIPSTLKERFLLAHIPLRRAALQSRDLHQSNGVYTPCAARRAVPSSSSSRLRMASRKVWICDALCQPSATTMKTFCFWDQRSSATTSELPMLTSTSENTHTILSSVRSFPSGGNLFRAPKKIEEPSSVWLVNLDGQASLLTCERGTSPSTHQLSYSSTVSNVPWSLSHQQRLVSLEVRSLTFGESICVGRTRALPKSCAF